ncbi:hypothetical protein R1sor_010010 [Riccia sorocarpa]|uniref:Uncharacterized protein n=1 Tax=Riccia sorocarpa TaxID=122646 RepID=A0ABD3HYR4_9MARC
MLLERVDANRARFWRGLLCTVDPWKIPILNDILRARRRLRLRILEAKGRGDGKYWYRACAFPLRDRGSEGERLCCRRLPAREGTPNRGHVCGSAGEFLQWHFYVKLGDDSVSGYELDEIPECVVFQAGEAFMGCRPDALLQLQPEEATSLLCGRLRGQWLIGLEVLQGTSGLELKVISCERPQEASAGCVLNDAALLPNCLLIEPSGSEEVASIFSGLGLEQRVPSLGDVEIFGLFLEWSVCLPIGGSSYTL